LSAVFNKKMAICLCTGFASGLPLYILIQLLPAWLRTSGVDLSTIGLFFLFQFSYNWKFVWAPLMDRYAPPFLGRRRGWMLITQIPLIVLTASLMGLQPNEDIRLIAVIVALLGFLGASQDIVLDAYRRELLDDHEMGMGSSWFVNAYKASSLVPGGLSLILADWYGWQIGIGVAVAFLFVGLITTLLIREMDLPEVIPTSLASAVIEPFKEFFSRQGVHNSLLILAFLVLYKLGDNMATALETPFFYDMGFSGTEIGSVAKLTKLWASVVGSLLGGYMMLRLGLARCLWIFGGFQILSILGYALLSQVGDSLGMLFVAVALEYLGVGLGTVGLLAYMSELTNRSFTATQFALLSSLAALPRTLASSSSGFIIEAVGYTQFFLICFLLAIPGMLLLLKIAPWNGRALCVFEKNSSV